MAASPPWSSFQQGQWSSTSNNHEVVEASSMPRSPAVIAAAAVAAVTAPVPSDAMAKICGCGHKKMTRFLSGYGTSSDGGSQTRNNRSIGVKRTSFLQTDIHISDEVPGRPSSRWTWVWVSKTRTCCQGTCACIPALGTVRVWMEDKQTQRQQELSLSRYDT